MEQDIPSYIADINAPVRLRKVRSDRQPWMTDEIKKLSFHRNYLKKKAVVLNSSAFHSAYKKCKNQLIKLISKAKTHYFRTSLENNKNCKENWTHINKLLNHKAVKTNTIDNIKLGDQNTTDNNKIANTFNSFLRKLDPNLLQIFPLHIYRPNKIHSALWIWVYFQNNNNGKLNSNNWEN